MNNLYDLNILDIEGNELSFSSFNGQVLLLVNVASECGLTPQYVGLQNLQNEYHAKGFNIIGFPCNQFGKQEPGNESDIKDFCTSHFSVDFPMMSKIDVNGSKRHPLYKFLAGKDAKFPGDITWNFEKFLMSKDGDVIQRFAPDVDPEAKEITDAIKKTLEE